LTLTLEPGRQDQELGPELGRFCCRRCMDKKSSTTPQSVGKGRRELMATLAVRPVPTRFVDVDAVRAPVLEILALLLVDALVAVGCDLPPGVTHSATPK
jgi:hypothetical protein